MDTLHKGDNNDDDNNNNNIDIKNPYPCIPGKQMQT
jgi:hypothetical protein